MATIFKKTYKKVRSSLKTITSLSNQTEDTTPRKALLIGINYVGTPNQLSGCVNDVLEAKRILVEKYKFLPSNILLLTDVEDANISISSPKGWVSTRLPTKENILKGFQWLIDEATSKSHLYLHYSGHGTYIRDLNGDEKDGRDECICPLDFQKSGFIDDDTIRARVAVALPRNASLVAIFDSCYSGSAMDLRFGCLVSPQKQSIVEDVHYSATTAKVVFISGCTDSQTSADAHEEGKDTGAMTYALFKALEGAHYRVSYINLIKKMRTILSEKHYSQVPQLSFGKYENLTALFLV